MSTIAEVLDEMADTLRDLYCDPDLDGLPVQVEPYSVPAPSALTVDMYPADPSSDSAGAGFGAITGQWMFTVRARTNTPSSFAAQSLLYALMDDEDPWSVAATLMEDQTLNGHAASVLVAGPFGMAPYLDDGGNKAFLGTEWRVTVLKATS